MFKLTASLFLSYLASASASHAAWYYHMEESTFGTDTHLLLAERSPYFFGLRCEGDEVRFVFSTPDRSFNAETMAMANAIDPIVLFKVDSGEVLNLSGEIRDNNGEAIITGPAEDVLLDSIENAKSKVSVALKLLGDVYHETQFGASGSTAKAKQFRRSCPAFAED